MELIKFHSSPNPTLGVEIELQLIDKNTLDLKNISPKILSNVNKQFSNKIKHELFESMIEINTDVCSNVAEVSNDIKQTLNYLEEILNKYNTTINFSSLHPFAKGKNQTITNDNRYKRIMKDLQIVGKRFITQGLHVHVGIDNCENVIKVNNALRIYLPLLLALSTSSPFYEGEDTGLYSYRTKIFESLPLAGLPDYLDNWNHFLNLTHNLMKARIINSVKDLWWEVRPHPGFGTVEIRICDIPTNFEEIIAIVAIIQALVVKIKNSDSYPDTHIQILESNKWQAVRYGLEGAFIDPVSLKQSTIRKSIEDLCALIEPTMISLKSRKYIKIIENILIKGTGTTKKKSLYKVSGNFQHMIKSLKEEFFQ